MLVYYRLLAIKSDKFKFSRIMRPVCTLCHYNIFPLFFQMSYVVALKCAYVNWECKCLCLKEVSELPSVMYIWVCMYVYVWVSVFVCMCVWVNVYVCACDVCVYVCMVCIYVWMGCMCGCV